VPEAITLGDTALNNNNKTTTLLAMNLLFVENIFYVSREQSPDVLQLVRGVGNFTTAICSQKWGNLLHGRGELRVTFPDERQKLKIEVTRKAALCAGRAFGAVFA
jgi:hypothetical protein